MSEQDGLIIACLLDGQGGGSESGWPEVRGWQPRDGLIWIHLDYSVAEAQRWLLEESGLAEVVAHALVADETRPRSVLTDHGLLLNLRGINSNPGADPEDMVSLRLWSDGHRVISTRRRRLLSGQDLYEAILRGQGPRNAGEFIVDLCDRLVDRMSDVIESVDSAVDDLEAEVVTGESQQLRMELTRVRREVILLRRYLAPQREAMQRLQVERVPWFDEMHRMRLRETADRVTRYVEELDAARDRAAVAHEELVSRLSEQMNQRMYVLSVVAGLFLPLGFLTGLLGINVGGIPGADNPFAFIGVSVFLVGLVALQVFMFRRKRWI